MKRFTSLVMMMLMAGMSMAITTSIGTTYQLWDFETAANPATPTEFVNDYGIPEALIEDTSFQQTGLTYDQRGIWYAQEMKAVLTIDNQPIANPYKEITVEIVYQGDIVLSWARNGQGEDFSLIDRQSMSLDNGWKKIVDTWRIEPNPDKETLCYGFNGLMDDQDVYISDAAIDLIKVSTVCIPEPATLLLLSAGLVLFRRKK